MKLTDTRFDANGTYYQVDETPCCKKKQETVFMFGPDTKAVQCCFCKAEVKEDVFKPGSCSHQMHPAKCNEHRAAWMESFR